MTVPSGFVTFTSANGLAPLEAAGVLHVIVASSITCTSVAGLPPNRTSSAPPVNPEPVSVTARPPALRPKRGDTETSPSVPGIGAGGAAGEPAVAETGSAAAALP